ncbi:hypothetical protein KBC54_04640, partial [Patescibacteria group bacterium]|nr:hypothetical protein [Patescibacteria group bacterium]
SSPLYALDDRAKLSFVIPIRRAELSSVVAHVGARWNELVSELERWHAFGKAREMAQTLA